ncbi:MAG: trigger factor, partial [Parvibaculum sp.]
MQVTETVSEGLKRELTIKIGAGTLNERVEGKLGEMKDQVRLKGFRPGKVPPAHLRRTFGRQVMTEVIQETVTNSSAEALQQRELRPALQPEINLDGEIEQVLEGKADLVFKVAFEIVPAFELADLSKIALERPTAEVSDADIAEALQGLASAQKNFEPKDGKAAEGDLVIIDFIGRIDGEPFDGGTAEDARLELGSGQFIPGFEDQLVGTKAGDKKDVTVSFPEEYGAEHLAGKEAVFETTVKGVEAPGEVVIDDAFAEKFGMENLDKLKEAVSQQIKGDYDKVSLAKMKREMLDRLDELHAFELPPTLVEQEFHQIWHQFEHELEHEGKTIADADQPEEELRAEYQTIAERRVRLGLVLSEIGSKNELKVEDAEVNRAIAQRAQQFPGQERQVYEFYTKNPQAIAEIRAPLFEDKVVAFVAEMAKVTDKVVSKEELLADPDSDEGDDAGADKKPAKKKAAAKKPAAKKKAAPK